MIHASFLKYYKTDFHFSTREQNWLNVIRSTFSTRASYVLMSVHSPIFLLGLLTDLPDLPVSFFR